MQLLKNLFFAELKALAYLLFLVPGVILILFMLLWNVLNIDLLAESSEEYIVKIKWDLGLIKACIIKPFETAVNGICEFIADAIIIPRQQASTIRRRQ